jgi:hypothetical protein
VDKLKKAYERAVRLCLNKGGTVDVKDEDMWNRIKSFLTRYHLGMGPFFSTPVFATSPKTWGNAVNERILIMEKAMATMAAGEGH